MNIHYNLDYSLPFIPPMVKAHKPALFVDIESRSHYLCIYEDNKVKIEARGRTPIEAIFKWQKTFEKTMMAA